MELPCNNNALPSVNIILHDCQSGFRSNHSTNSCKSNEICNICIVYRILREGLMTGIILTHLQKAFDSINRKDLFKKIKAIRFLDSSIQFYPVRANKDKYNHLLSNKERETLKIGETEFKSSN